MNRRSLLKQFVFITAGVVFLPTCTQDKSKASILLKNIKIDGADEQLLAELSETIIPVTDTPGAKDVSAHLYALKMVDDCSGHADQEKFINGLNSFKQFAKKTIDKSFVEASSAERSAVVQALESAGKSEDELSYFYSTIKRLTIQGYSTSEYYLTKVHVYELVPGRYKGCVPVSSV